MPAADPILRTPSQAAEARALAGRARLESIAAQRRRKLGLDESGRPRITIHRKQAEALRCTERFLAIIAGTGGGKTWMGPIWLIGEINKDPQGEYLVVSPTHSILRNATMPMLKRHFKGTKLAGRYLESKGRYVLPSGGVIHCVSADQPYGFEGVHVKAAWCDEAGQYSRMAWVVIQARLGRNQGRCLFTSTPYGLNWLYDEVYKRARDGDPDYRVIQFTSADNPFYPVEEYERAKRSMSPALFQMRYGGQFTRMEGLVYPEFHTCVVDAVPADLVGEKVGACDFGFKNPFAGLKAVLDDDDCLWVTAERYESERQTREHAEWLGNEHAYIGDPAGAQFIDDLMHMGVNIRAGDNDIDSGIEAVTERIKLGRLRVSREACPNLIDESETYHYDAPTEKSEARAAKPVKVKDHAMDALRYLCLWLRQRHHDAPRMWILG